MKLGKFDPAKMYDLFFFLFHLDNTVNNTNSLNNVKRTIGKSSNEKFKTKKSWKRIKDGVGREPEALSLYKLADIQDCTLDSQARFLESSSERDLPRYKKI